jgi:predicted Zn-dependent protease
MPWWGWTLFGVFGFGIVGLIAYGVLKDRAKRNEPEPCGLDGIEKWDSNRAPFTITLAPDFPNYDIVANAITQAILFWQEAVPELELFASFGDVARGGVVGWMPMDTLIGTPWYEAHKQAFAWAKLTLTEDKGIGPNPTVYVATDVVPGLTFLQLWRAIAHELGHVLGLAHDPNIRESIMHPTALSEAPVVTENDRVWLLKIYEPGTVTYAREV